MKLKLTLTLKFNGLELDLEIDFVDLYVNVNELEQYSIGFAFERIALEKHSIGLVPELNALHMHFIEFDVDYIEFAIDSIGSTHYSDGNGVHGF